MPHRAAAVVYLLGSVLEAGVGPFLLTGGFAVGGAWEDAIWLRVLGGALVAAGLVALVHTHVRFAAGDGPLVVSGPYGRVRNPMYAATAVVIAGEGLLLSQPVLLAGAALYVAVLAALVRLVEEPHLRARFGPEYDVYRRQVPGWLPRVTAPGAR